jgi:hypothetical protein
MTSFMVSTDATSSRVKISAKLFSPLLRIGTDEASYGFTNGFSVAHLDVPTDDCEYGQSLNSPPMPRSRPILAMKFVGIDRSFFIHIDNSYISV